MFAEFFSFMQMFLSAGWSEQGAYVGLFSNENGYHATRRVNQNRFIA